MIDAFDLRPAAWNMPRRWAFLLLLAAQIGLVHNAAMASLVRVEIDDGVFVNLTARDREGLDLGLECHVPAGGDPQGFYEQFLADSALAGTYSAARSVVLPFTALKPEIQREVLLALFPDDYVTEQGWHHRVRFADGEMQETLWGLCEWFTGSGLNWHVVRQVNTVTHASLEKHADVLIPANVLRPHLRQPTPDRQPPPPPVEPERIAALPEVSADPVPDTVVTYDPLDEDSLILAAEAWSGDAVETVENSIDDLASYHEARQDLSFGRDAHGEYAAYHLKKGEALYSAVAVRFTDYTGHLAVMSAIEQITARSGIRDVRNIREGSRILIPVDMLAAQFRPITSEARREYEAAVAEANRLSTQMRREARSKDLDGVVVVLDPGHGSRDTGKMYAPDGLYESEIVYDIVCRIKAILERDTHARVYVTMTKPKQGFAITDATRFSHDRSAVILTSPPYPARPEQYDTRVAANLRFYLANDIYDREVKAGADPRKIVFSSIHIDSLHPRLRGAMIYIPGARHRERNNGEFHTSPSYQGIQEVRRVSYTANEARRDEALSRAFAETLYHELGAMQVKRHDVGPAIRSEIRQTGGVVYVPAVIRGNKIPTKILLECANMNNETDRRRMADPKWRQRVAEAYVNALKAHYGS